MNTINALAKDAQCFKVGKIHIIEIMGRNAGWLTAAADLLPEDTRPHLFYLPENNFDMAQFIEDVRNVYREHGYGIVAISEGINIQRDNANARVDGFGHAQLGGAATYLCDLVEQRLGLQLDQLNSHSYKELAQSSLQKLTKKKQSRPVNLLSKKHWKEILV